MINTKALRTCLCDPGQAGRDAYRDPAHNTNSNEYLYDPATYPAWTGSRQQMPGSKQDEKFPYKFERFKNLKK
jgi:hypothetical protein